MRESRLDSAVKLPRGPHRLPRDIVVAHQRERILAATAVALAEHGYSSLSVRHVIEQAHVSRTTFYEQFENKHECVIAAYDAALEHLTDAIFKACALSPSWPAGVVAAVGVALDFASERPELASLLIISQAAVADPRLSRHALASQEVLVRLLRAGRDGQKAERDLLGLTEQALLGATMAVVGARLHGGRLDSLDRLKPELAQFILAPYLGEEEAVRVVGPVA